MGTSSHEWYRPLPTAQLTKDSGSSGHSSLVVQATGLSGLASYDLSGCYLGKQCLLLHQEIRIGTRNGQGGKEETMRPLLTKWPLLGSSGQRERHKQGRRIWLFQSSASQRDWAEHWKTLAKSYPHFRSTGRGHCLCQLALPAYLHPHTVGRFRSNPPSVEGSGSG